MKMIRQESESGALKVDQHRGGLDPLEPESDRGVSGLPWLFAAVRGPTGRGCGRGSDRKL